MIIQYILHKELNDENLKKIIDIKSIAWPYSFEKQLKWIENNIKDEDIHVLLLDDNNAITAYLNMVSINFTINNVNYSGYGIGNVCASKRGSGKGALLMHKLNKYFVDNKIIGLLFCKEELLNFYNKQGWKHLSEDKVIVNGINDQVKIMILNYGHDSIEKLIYTQRIF